MKNFNDIAALRCVLQHVYEKLPSEPEQRLAGFASFRQMAGRAY